MRLFYTRLAESIANYFDRLPVEVARRRAKQLEVMAATGSGRHALLLANLLANFRSYGGDFRNYYNTVALEIYNSSLQRSIFLLGNRRLLNPEILDANIPEWRTDRSIVVIDVDTNVSLFSARGNRPIIYVPGSIVVLKGQLVVGVIQPLGEAFYQHVE